MPVSQLELSIDFRNSLCLDLIEFLIITSYRIHLGPDSDELSNGPRAAVFVFPFTKSLLILRTVQDVRFRILAAVEMIRCVDLHFFVYITGFDGIRQTVRPYR